MTNDVEMLLQYLLQGDFLGFLTGCFTTRIGQNFYAILALIFSIPLYNRTQNVMYCSLVWIILGGLFIIAMPLVSPVAVLLVTLGVSVTLLKLFTNRG